MVRLMKREAKRPRISLDVAPAVRRRIRLAAAKRELSVQQYLLEAVRDRLREDLGASDGAGFAAAIIRQGLAAQVERRLS